MGGGGDSTQSHGDSDSSLSSTSVPLVLWVFGGGGGRACCLPPPPMLHLPRCTDVALCLAQPTHRLLGSCLVFLPSSLSVCLPAFRSSPLLFLPGLSFPTSSRPPPLPPRPPSSFQAGRLAWSDFLPSTATLPCLLPCRGRFDLERVKGSRELQHGGGGGEAKTLPKWGSLLQLPVVWWES